jgi:hypothetical protein
MIDARRPFRQRRLQPRKWRRWRNCRPPVAPDMSERGKRRVSAAASRRVSVGAWGDAEEVEQYLQRLKGKIADFEDRLGDRLSRERRDLYALLLDRAPRLAHRTVM